MGSSVLHRTKTCNSVRSQGLDRPHPRYNQMTSPRRVRPLEQGLDARPKSTPPFHPRWRLSALTPRLPSPGGGAPRRTNGVVTVIAAHVRPDTRSGANDAKIPSSRRRYAGDLSQQPGCWIIRAGSVSTKSGPLPTTVCAGSLVRFHSTLSGNSRTFCGDLDPGEVDLPLSSCLQGGTEIFRGVFCLAPMHCSVLKHSLHGNVQRASRSEHSR